MVASLREVRSQGLTIEDINRRSLERMKGRGKYR